jgi:hypothetical protein
MKWTWNGRPDLVEQKLANRFVATLAECFVRSRADVDISLISSALGERRKCPLMTQSGRPLDRFLPKIIAQTGRLPNDHRHWVVGFLQ